MTTPSLKLKTFASRTSADEAASPGKSDVNQQTNAEEDKALRMNQNSSMQNTIKT